MSPARSGGFTLLEVILAMALFSFMLLIIVVGFLNLMNIYEYGLATRATQDNAQFGIDDVVQYSHSAYQAKVVTATHAGYLSRNSSQICLYEAGGMEQYYAGPAPGYGLYRYQQPVGTTCSVISSGGQLITAGDVSVVNLVASATSGTPQSLSVTLSLAPVTAAHDGTVSFSGSNAMCSLNAKYCSTSTLATVVSLQGVNPQEGQ